MTRRRQKQEELYRVGQLQRALGGPPGTLEEADGPDVIVRDGDRRVGVEVVELYQRSVGGHSPARLQESERTGIVGRAQGLAAESGVPIVDVSVRFKDSPQITKKDREPIVASLVEVVATHIPDFENAHHLELWRERRDLPWVGAVRIFRTKALTKHHWWSSESGWVQTDFLGELQHAIDEKNVKLQRYMQHCDECWLLIVANGGRPSGLFQPSSDTLGHVYRSGFAKTFYMEAFGGHAILLPTIAV